MTLISEKILEEISDLTVEERMDIADRILRTLHPVDAGVDAAWASEIARRVGEYERGEVELLDGPTVLKELRSRYE